jgi:hypothetical protein
MPKLTHQERPHARGGGGGGGIRAGPGREGGGGSRGGGRGGSGGSGGVGGGCGRGRGGGGGHVAEHQHGRRWVCEGGAGAGAPAADCRAGGGQRKPRLLAPSPLRQPLLLLPLLLLLQLLVGVCGAASWETSILTHVDGASSSAVDQDRSATTGVFAAPVAAPAAKTLAFTVNTAARTAAVGRCRLTLSNPLWKRLEFRA